MTTPVPITEIIHGDELLVDGNPYTGAGIEWGTFERTAPGSASVYPLKVRLSNGALGQFKLAEVQAARRPDWLQTAIDEASKHDPGWLGKMQAQARCPH
jgi:hypothetical protein